MLFRTMLVLVVSLAWTAALVAQEKDSKAPDAKAKAAKSDLAKAKASAKKAAPAEPAAGTPAEQFAKLYREFRENVGRLQQLQQKYNTDQNADKKALEEEFNAKVESTKALEVNVAAAAEKAYLAAPNQDSDQNNYLLARLSKLVATDDFEEAARLAKLMIDNQYKAKYFNVFAGLAFFGANDFDNAEKYLKLAEKEGDFAEAAQRPVAAMGAQTLELIGKHNYKELWAAEQALRAAEDKAGDLPIVKLSTTQGDITLQLFENQAPIATNNFVSLVEKKFYDGTKFHRVLPGFMAQGGDPKGDGSGGPGYRIPDEYKESRHRNHFRGTLSMARTGAPDSGGSQFFLCFKPVDHLDGQYTVFGRVIDGFDVLAKLQRCEAGDTNVPDKIVRATVVSKRDHKYEPSVKLPDK
jgi:cyclophilin family peptidyl-prolyl cis-trans isomerase